MKTTQRNGKAAFTLIELMAVITIIVILAGLVVGGLGFVTERQAKEKARVQIALLSKAIEEYKLDMGTYPPTANSTNAAPGQSAILFKALYWDSDNDGAGAATGAAAGDQDQKIYLAQLDPGTTTNPNKQGWTSGTPGAGTKIMDPWGKEYNYRSGLNAAGVVNAGTQNPDFDLWTSGKDGLSNNTPSNAQNRDDIKNF
jgi:general secretion pathway protein G